jgi:hypothetical protein
MMVCVACGILLKVHCIIFSFVFIFHNLLLFLLFLSLFYNAYFEAFQIFANWQRITLAPPVYIFDASFIFRCRSLVCCHLSFDLGLFVIF